MYECVCKRRMTILCVCFKYSFSHVIHQSTFIQPCPYAGNTGLQDTLGKQVRHLHGDETRSELQNALFSRQLHHCTEMKRSIIPP